ncbi:MAG: anaerobic sulfatase maturase [Candidatus Auribacter fodinae]|jgi:uncharacterized protein|uniref:Anaerobic sulfatase maturase n=1 Tax=Candidatus Auribacter fodinae TaxID=2093366 RepID=A0A3A4QQP5_9BACT|nr:MAG: anaerobic sulfatase maturase [Candidatus Auribacter fodinae]
MIVNSFANGIHAIAKPTGSVCNLKCDYCFYLEKRNLYPTINNFQMSDEVLSAYIDKYVNSQPTPEVEFVWQGGEPTLLGIDFFRKVVDYQKPYRTLKKIKNSLQTNGTLLTDKWCAFLKTNNFLVGLSIDGPKEIHDRYRHSHDGGSRFKSVMKSLRLLQKHKVDFNVMACVAKETAYRPLDVYHFFKQEGVEFIQFTPIIERVPDQKAVSYGLNLAMPALLDTEEPNKRVTHWTVEPEKYADFLIAIFDEWVRHDVGKIFIMNFEWALNAAIGNGSPVCIFSQSCGRAVAVEQNGDVYACDHYVYPEYRLGNILYDDLGLMVDASFNSGFGRHKENTLPHMCKGCDVLRACWGGCPKHRFAQTDYGEPGVHYLCASYKKFFKYISKYLEAIIELMSSGRPASDIMKAVKITDNIDLTNIKNTKEVR